MNCNLAEYEILLTAVTFKSSLFAPYQSVNFHTFVQKYALTHPWTYMFLTYVRLKVVSHMIYIRATMMSLNQLDILKALEYSS